MGRFVAGVLCGLLVAAVALAALSLATTDLPGVAPQVTVEPPSVGAGADAVLVPIAPGEEPGPVGTAPEAGASGGPEVIQETVPVLPAEPDAATDGSPADADG